MCQSPSAMDPKEVERYLVDFQGRELPALTERALKVPGGTKIIAIIGPRRAGKTSYLHLAMRAMMRDGWSKAELVYLSFESTRLFDLGFKEMREAVEMHRRLFPAARRPALFLDEPQNVPNWELAVREMHDEGFRIFISGSSSRLLGREIATALRGRCLSYLLLPFSFREFLDHRGIVVPERIGSDDRTRILGLLDEYLEFGGFPEVASAQDNDTKLRILESYLDLTVYRDLVERHGMRDTQLVKWLIRSIASSYTKEVSIHKLYDTLRSQGRRLSKDELYACASLLNDALFVFYLPKFSWSVRKREPVSKVFLCDTGFAKLVEAGRDRGKKMENAFYLEMLRRKGPATEYFFWKNAQQEEVDLVVKEGARITRLVQVSGDADAGLREREIRSLLKAGKDLGCTDLVIMTDDLEAEREEEWRGITGRVRLVPLWRFLLGEAEP